MPKAACTISIAQEVQRVVGCRYAVQLKTLYDIVIIASAFDIESWASAHPSQTHNLARHVIDALYSWPYVLELATRLATCRPFRDALIDVDPNLLEHAAQLAVNQKDHRAVQWALSLLQHKLRPADALPSAVQTLLATVFEHVAQVPSIGSVRSLFVLISGAARPLIDVLPASERRDFERQMFRILGEERESQAPVLSLYCLTILGISCGRIHPSGQSHLAHFSHASDDSTAFFSGTKAHKTLHLLALRVIWACKLDVEQDQSTETQTCIALAAYIVSGVDATIKREWTAKNTALVSKVFDRADRAELSLETNFLVSAFIGALCEPVVIEARVVKRYCDSLGRLAEINLTEEIFDGVASLSFNAFASSFTTEQWLSLLTTAFGLHLEQDSSSSNMARNRIASLMRETIPKLTQLAQLQTALSQIVCRVHLAAQLRAFCHGPQRHHIDLIDSMASHAASGKSICTLLLAGMSFTRENQDDLPVLAAQVLERHTDFARLELRSEQHFKWCTQDAPRLNMQSKPRKELIPKAGYWRDHISSVVQHQADEQKQFVAIVFSELCSDLEQRCANVEAPLKVEQQKVVELTANNEECRQAYAEIERRFMDQDICVKTLRKESERLANDLSRTIEERENLFQRVQASERQLHAVQISTSDELKTLRDQLVEAEIASATRFACAQDSIDTSRDETRALKVQLEEVEAQLQRAHNAMTAKKHEVAHLQQQLATFASQSETAQNELQEMTRQHQSNLEDNKALRDQIRTREMTIASLQYETRQAVDKLVEQATTRQQEIERLHASFEDKLASERQQWISRLAGLEATSENQQIASTREIADLGAQVQDLSTHLTRSRKQIERLTTDLDKKDVQIHEAQDMRARLINAMGLAKPGAEIALSQSSPRHSTLPIRSLSSGETSTPDRRRSRRHISEEAAPPRLNETLDTSTTALQSPRRTTRSRPRTAFKVPSMNRDKTCEREFERERGHDHDHQRGVVTTASRVLLQSRRPLAEMSVNNSPRKQAQADVKNGEDGDREVQEKCAGAGLMSVEVENRAPHTEVSSEAFLSTACRNAVGDWSFDGDEITGTPAFGNCDETKGGDDRRTGGILNGQVNGKGFEVKGLIAEAMELDEDLISTVST